MGRLLIGLVAFTLLLPLPAAAESEPPSQVTAQIVGGEVVEHDGWPWQVALVAAGAEDPLAGQFCSGVLVAPGWVLTAAHCVVDGDGRAAGPGAFEVVGGTAVLVAGAGVTVDIEEVVPHPTASEETGFDAALVRVDRIEASPIGLAGAGAAVAGTTTVTTGWGRTTGYRPGDDAPSGAKPAALREVALPIREDDACYRAYGVSYDPETMLCVGGEGSEGACQGDSGGPVLVAGSNGEWLLAGLTSWGSGCAAAGYPDVATRAAGLEEWIQSVTGQGVQGVRLMPVSVVVPGLAQD